MFTEACAYDSKDRSVMKKTLTASLLIHLLLGAMLLFWPFPGNDAPKAAEPEKQIIKLTSVPAAKQETQPQKDNLPPVPQNTVSHQPPPVLPQPINKPAPAKPETIPPVKPVPSPVPAAAPLPAATVAAPAAPQAVPAAPAAKAGDNAPVSDLDNIRARFISILEKNKEYPYIARRQNQTGLVGLAVSLDVSGNLQNVSITKSSGFSQIDNAALALARKVCPFAHNAGRTITMNVSINYDLKG